MSVYKRSLRLDLTRRLSRRPTTGGPGIFEVSPSGVPIPSVTSPLVVAGFAPRAEGGPTYAQLVRLGGVGEVSIRLRSCVVPDD